MLKDDYQKWFGISAGLISAGAFAPYIFSIIRGKTKPSIATWLTWTIVGLLTFISYISASGWTNTVWVAIAYVILPGIVVCLAIVYPKKCDMRVSLVEMICLLGVLFGVCTWYVSMSAEIALAVFLAIDCLGTIPTIVKSYYYPYDEDAFAWLLSLTGNTLNLFAVREWNFAEASYPVYLALSIWITAAVIIFRRRSIH